MKKKAILFCFLAGGLAANVLVLKSHKGQDSNLMLENIEELSAVTMEMTCDGSSDAVCLGNASISGVPIKIEGTGELRGEMDTRH